MKQWIHSLDTPMKEIALFIVFLWAMFKFLMPFMMIYLMITVKKLKKDIRNIEDQS